MSRDFNQESRDLPESKYAYEFDNILRSFMLRSFMSHFSPGNALEMGCYHGEFTEHLARYFPSLTVIEAASDLIEVAQKRVGSEVKFIHATFEDARFKSEYDAVFLVHTLEHLDDPVGILKKVGEWLSPRGKLFLAVPNADAASRQIAVKMGLISHNQAVTESERKHGHRKTYSMDTLVADVRQAGLAIRDRGGVFFKGLANYQIDQALELGVIDQKYLEGCYQLGMQHPEFCASIYLICEKSGDLAG